MTTNVEQELKTIRDDIATAQETATRARVRKEQAEERKEAAMAELKKTFKVDSVEAAQDLSKKFTDKMEQEIDKAKTELAAVTSD